MLDTAEKNTRGLQAYSLMLASHMLDWYQFRLPPTRLGSSSFGVFGSESGFGPRSPSTSRFFPSSNPAATDEVVIW